MIFNCDYPQKSFPLPPVLLCVSAGGGEGHPVFERQAGAVQEAGCALGTRTGKGKCHNLLIVFLFSFFLIKQKVAHVFSLIYLAVSH